MADRKSSIWNIEDKAQKLEQNLIAYIKSKSN